MTCEKCGYEFCICQEIEADIEVNKKSTKVSDTDAKEQLKWIFYFMIGLVLYPIVKWMFITNYICMMINIFVHEVGHGIVALFFGYISVPMVNVFLVGESGGISVPIAEFGRVGTFLLFGILFLLLWKFADYFGGNQIVWMSGILGVLLVTTIVFFRERQVLIYAGGHVFVAIGAGIMLYLSGFYRDTKPVNRPIYSTIGWWGLLDQFDFYNKLISDSNFKQEYFNGGITNDLVYISNVSKRLSFESVVNIFTTINYVPLVLIIIILIFTIAKTFVFSNKGKT